MPFKNLKIHFKKWQVCVQSHITYFHQGALVYSQEPNAKSSIKQPRDSPLLKTAFLPQQNLFSKMPVNYIKNSKLLPLDLRKNALFPELVEELQNYNERNSFPFQRIQKKKWYNLKELYVIDTTQRTKLQEKRPRGALVHKNNNR